jgi:hypothetical protein
LNRGEHQDRRLPEPLPTSAASPEFPFKHTGGRRQNKGFGRSPIGGEAKIGAWKKRASAFVSSGYAIVVWGNVET